MNVLFSHFMGHEIWHLGAALILGALVYLLYKKWTLSLLCAVSALMPDVDHLFEYFLVFGFKFDLRAMLNGKYFTLTDYRFLWFHAYELLVLVWLWVWFKKKYFQGAVAFSLGYLSHLLVDQFSYPVLPFAYSFFYRLFHHFHAEAFGEWSCKI